MRRGTVHPPELAELFKGLRVHPYELEAEQLLPFVPGAANIDQSKDRHPDLAPWCYGAARAAKAVWPLDIVLEIRVAPVIGSYSG